MTTMAASAAEETSNLKAELHELKAASEARTLKLCQTMLSFALQGIAQTFCLHKYGNQQSKDRKVQHVVNSLRVHGCNSYLSCALD